LFAFVFTSDTALAFACTCVPPNPIFCSNFSESSNIDSIEFGLLTAVLIDDLDYNNTSKRKAIVLEELFQGFGEDTITLKGQDGWNCGEDLSQFALGDTLVMALKEWTDFPDTTILYYLEGACGRHYLNLTNNMVEGNFIYFQQSEMLYKSFKENLVDCIDYYFNFWDYVPGVNNIFEELKVYPIPASNNFQIKSPIDINSVKLYNSSGKLLMKYENINSNNINIDSSEFGKGIYILKMEIDGNYISKMLPII